MPDTDSQDLPFFPRLLPSSKSTESPSRCGVMQPDQATTPSRNDRWLKPRPNTIWQDVENQRFIDLPRFNDESLDDEEYGSSDEDEDEDEYEDEESGSCNEIPDGEGRGSGSEDEVCHVGNEAERGHSLACNDSNGLGMTDEGILGTCSESDSQLPGLIFEQIPKHGTPTEILDPMEQEDDAIAHFLRAIEDQDLHRDSIARLRKFFKTAKLEVLEQRSMAWKESRILLEDRNFSAKHFRPYPRSLTPKQLYDALQRQVMLFSHCFSSLS